MPKKRLQRRHAQTMSIGVIDFETDPFVHGRIPKPFAAGVMVHGPDNPLPEYRSFWGDDCVDLLLGYLSTIKTPHIIYAHNGGKFDFHFLLDRLDKGSILCIRGRIVKAKFGIHEFRDSWPIIPMALHRANNKMAIDYARFERDQREQYRAEILEYLKLDCKYLYELVDAFIDRFGLKLTAPSAASAQLKKLHPQPLGNESSDKLFRPYYFGGRVECFKSGVMRGDFKVYDVNSMYPHVMREYDHPKGHGYARVENVALDKDGWIKGFSGYFYFAEVVGENRGALPMRGARSNDPLSFGTTSGRFLTTSHELRLAISLGLFEVRSIAVAYIARETQRFTEFVDKFAAEKIASKLAGNKIAETFSKLMLNSAYGRFGIDPYEFKEHLLYEYGETCEEEGYQLDSTIGMLAIWSRRKFSAENKPRYSDFENVAVAASITSAARSVLLRALSVAVGTAYCDTDSIICSSLQGVPFSDSAIGAWKLEAEGDTLAIAGKKLYTLLSDGKEVKSASKGVKLSCQEIIAVASGSQITWKSEAPSFSITGATRFTTRRVNATSAKVPKPFA